MVGDLADIDEVSAGTASGSADPQPSPEAELIRRADQKVVSAAIAELALPVREVLVLRDVNGFSYKEIAEVLNLPIGTVMSRLARGRQQLAASVKRAAQ
jgi:RNA polymerase sigma-70 factor (ECF subfamily)